MPRNLAGRRKQAGFTLVEIAIVLVIIGLLLGGVLKGQELINSAKVKNFATDFRNIPLFIYGYQDKYKALPGDDANIAAHVGATVGGVAITQIALVSASGTAGNGRLDGNWFDDATTIATSESVAFWQQIRAANLAAGPINPTDPNFIPTNADGGKIGIQSGTNVPGRQYISGLSGTYLLCSSGILGKYAKQLDSNMDDGNPATGSMMAIPMPGNAIPPTPANAPSCNVVGTPASCTAAIVDTDPYIVCMSI